ncbi:MAG: XdhC family protein [Methylophilaceae bacterium]|jgi:xanthine dehydrogenase accessory factor|nr:MAG: XdhC family protein [Methylophilaceae bacterium]
MDSQDLAVLTQAQRWLQNGCPLLLVTVVKTWGSSPRPVGALLALRHDGRAAGSISGGCIEDDLMYRLRKEGMPKRAELVTYGETAEEARRLGLPCGGSMQLVLEPITQANALDEVLCVLNQGQLVARRLDINAMKSSIAIATSDQTTELKDGELTSIYGPRYRLILIGAGQLSQLLANIALSLDFAVTICDPREEYADGWHVPNTQLRREMPDDVVMAMQPDARTAVITLTHDPKLDDLALMEALKSPAFYVAALGSRSNNRQRRERLLSFDVTLDQVENLRGPAGLFIGSKTPSEIAVSIAAELIAVKNGVEANRLFNVNDAKTALDIAEDTLNSCRI